MSSSRATTAPAEVVEEPVAASLATEEQRKLLDGLSTHEKLLVSQAAYEKGGDDWKGVAKLLKGHALLKTAPDAKRCEEIHAALTRGLGLEIDPELAPQAPQLLTIARKWYLERVYELREQMQQEQDRFLITYAEIEEIKAGKMDHLAQFSAPSSHTSFIPTTTFFPGLTSPDLSKPAPLPMFAFPPSGASTTSALPAKKGRGGKRVKGVSAAAVKTKPADEWVDWKPQGMPEVEESPSRGLMPLPELNGLAGGLQFGLGTLPALPDLPPLPELPALPAGDAMEGVEGA